MTWWALTLLSNARSRTTLLTYAETNSADHLFMAWAHFKPARHPIYKTVRGATVQCGYRYIWDTPNIAEQSQFGDSIPHTFYLVNLPPTAHTWYYLFAPGGPYGRQIQGPLVHVPPQEATMPSARIFHAFDQPIPTHVPTPATFDSVLWDDGGFYSPAAPKRLTIPLAGLYSFGCCLRMENAVPPSWRAYITLSGGDPVVQHSHRQEGLDWGGCAISMSTLMPLELGDFLQAYILHLAGGNRNLLGLDNYSPHFWIAYLGPNPT